MKTKAKQRTLLAFGLAVCLVLTLVFGLPFAKKTTASAASNADPDLSMFRFTKITAADGSKHYSIALLDYSLKSVMIPDKHPDGLLVKEIANNGFAYCDQLQSILIPETITKIGTSAFVGCESLEYINLTHVEVIGQNAFSLCENLKGIAFPDTVKTMGVGVLKYSSPQIIFEAEKNEINLSPTWLTGYTGNTNDIIYGHKGIAGDLNSDGDGYVIWSSNGINEPDMNIALDYYNEDNATNPNPYEKDEEGNLKLRDGSLKITHIKMGAFPKITLNSLSIGKFSNHEIWIESGAFSSARMNIKGLYFGNNVKFLSKNPVNLPNGNEEEFVTGPSVSVFTDSNVETIVLPDTLEVIGESMFQNCGSLSTIKFVSLNEENTLSPKINTIKAAAFANCSLPSLRITNSVLYIETLTSTDTITSPFEGWQNETVAVFFKATETKPVGWAENWLPEGINPKYAENTPAPEVYTVTLNKMGGIGGTSSVQATFGQPMPPAIAPTKTGYTFAGYFAEDGVQYYKAGIVGTTMVSVRPWDRKGNTTLFAAWTPASNPNPNYIPIPNQSGLVIDLNLDVLTWNNNSILKYLNKDLILLPPDGRITPPVTLPPVYR